MQLARGLVAQAEVVHALVLRETRTRFGAHQLGYLWALVEPVLMILTFYMVFRLANRKMPPGMDAMSFIATGIVPFHLFSNTVTRISAAIDGNKALLFYPQVRPIDLVFARALLETATYIGVFVVLMTGHALIVQRFEIDSALATIAGLVLAAMLGSTLGLVFCTLSQFSNMVDMLRSPLLRPMFWISGVFFTADQLPDSVQGGLLSNPLLHTVELVRGGWFESYGTNHADVPYVLAWILVLAFIGLSLERVVRQRIELA